MTATQICTLIVLILLVGLTYWAGYRGGLIDGRLDGIDEGKDIQQSDNSEAIHNLRLSLEQARNNHKQLYSHYERALAASKLGEPARQTLLEIAEKLRIAAETFSAFRTGKKLERDSLALRDQALAMAVLLEQTAQEDAA
jgi:cbb3-type cytochrome oxidase subunit 3